MLICRIRRNACLRRENGGIGGISLLWFWRKRSKRRKEKWSERRNVRKLWRKNTNCILRRRQREKWELTAEGKADIITPVRRGCACVAQLVEQLTRNEQVAGSSPATSSKRPRTPLSAGSFYAVKGWIQFPEGIFQPWWSVWSRWWALVLMGVPR